MGPLLQATVMGLDIKITKLKRGNQWDAEGLFDSCERIHSKNAILESFMLQFRLVRGIAVKKLTGAWCHPELGIKDRVDRLISKLLQA